MYYRQAPMATGHHRKGGTSRRDESTTFAAGHKVEYVAIRCWEDAGMDRSFTRVASTARLSTLIFIAAAALLPLSARSQGNNSIQGQIRLSTAGELPPHITVKLEVAEDIVVDQQLAGTTGKFEFLNLRDQFYRIIVTADGYQPATAQVDMSYYASRFPTIYLVPLGPKRTPAPPSESTTDLAAPKKARKEYAQGHEALQAKDYPGARQHFEKAIETDPCYARALTELGVVLTLQQEFASAETSFHKSMHCDGGFLEAYLQMGILLDIEKKYPEGEAVLKQALRIAPSDWQPYYRLGALHHHDGRYKEAQDEYLKAESLSAAVPAEIHLRLADVYLKQEDYDQAYAEMQNYLRIAPDGPLAKQTRSSLQEVDSLRKSKTQSPAGPN